MADWCPMKKYDFDKKEHYGCFKKVHVDDLETDTEMKEEIERRKAKRKKLRYSGLWQPPGDFPYGHSGYEKYDVCPCEKCDKIFDSIFHLNNHNLKFHSYVTINPESEEKWYCSYCDLPPFDETYLLCEHLKHNHPEIKPMPQGPLL